METELLILDILGTCAFAMYGAYYAVRKRCDIFGIAVGAFLTALGGGTLREIMLGHQPFYFFDNRYLIAVGGGIALTMALYRIIPRITPLMLTADAVGLVTFAFIGANAALEANLGLFPCVFFAVITAAGGGMMRDIVLNDMPSVLHTDFYATVAIIVGGGAWMGRAALDNMLFVNCMLTACLCLRLWAIVSRANLWKPRHART